LTANQFGAPHIMTVSEIARGPNEYVLWKQRWDPWEGTNLEMILRNRGVNTIIANGGATEIGIAATAFGAHRLDFDLVVVSDGCYSTNAHNHEVFMKRIFPGMGRVRTSEEVLLMLRAGLQG
jgi:nicotinamidase-related amidase